MMHNPKTKEMINKAKVAANKPENRAKVKQLQAKLTSRGRGQHGDHHPGGPTGPGTGTSPGTDAGHDTYGSTESGGRSGF